MEKAAFLHASDVDPALLMDKGDELIDRYTSTPCSNAAK